MLIHQVRFAINISSTTYYTCKTCQEEGETWVRCSYTQYASPFRRSNSMDSMLFRDTRCPNVVLDVDLRHQDRPGVVYYRSKEWSHDP